MLILSPEGGLCNRLRALASAISLKSRIGCDVNCAWRICKVDINAHFLDLFSPIPAVNFIPYLPVYDKLLPQYSRFPLKNSYSSLVNKVHGFDEYVHADSRHLSFAVNHLNSINESLSIGNVFVRSWQSFEPFNSSHLPLVPIGRINNLVTKISSDFNSSTYGIHIRRTDNSVAKALTPISFFYDILDSCLDTNPQSNFFLATDDSLLDRKFVYRYGLNRFHVFDKEFTRQSTRGIEDAVIDLMCLSKTSKIYGSHGSSFSSLASTIGNIPLLLPMISNGYSSDLVSIKHTDQYC